MTAPEQPPLLERLRLDIWLDVACLYKTRSEAQRAVQAGKVDVGGQHAKPHRELKIGETVTISRPFGRKQVLVVRGLVDRHIPKADARALYEDVTPPPSPEEQVILDLIRQTRRQPSPVAPDKRARRVLRQIKESGG
jgi:ribosome-associated heat shock protein Hsp15